MQRRGGLSTVNCAACGPAPRVKQGQNLAISLLNSLLAGKCPLESGSLETARTAIESKSFVLSSLIGRNSPIPAANSSLWFHQRNQNTLLATLIFGPILQLSGSKSGFGMKLPRLFAGFVGTRCLPIPAADWLKPLPLSFFAISPGASSPKL
jgi:hypothetical protein